MNIRIMRAFVRLREILATHKDLARKIEQIEAVQDRHDSIIMSVVDEIEKLKQTPEPPRRPIGFVRGDMSPRLSSRSASFRTYRR